MKLDNAMCCQRFGIWKIHALLTMKKAHVAILESNLAEFGQVTHGNTMNQKSYFLVHTQRNSNTIL